MIEQLVLPNTPLEHPSMDYAFLRQEGIRHLERMSGRAWTDFNTHDPGITILEQFCYALTDLGGRIHYTIPDLLTGEGTSLYASLPTAGKILPQNALTLLDLRKVVMDVAGVRNAWVVKAVEAESSSEEISLFYHIGNHELLLRAEADSSPYVVEKLQLKGLYRVEIEPVAQNDNATILGQVFKCLQHHRALGVDFEALKFLEVEQIKVKASVEVDGTRSSSEILRAIYQRLADYMAPSVPFYTLNELLAEGWRIDEIFEGPQLKNGFIKNAELEKSQRRTELRTSDMIREIMDVPGVKAVRSIGISKGGESIEAWALALESNKVPRLAPSNVDELLRPEITLQKNGLKLDRDHVTSNKRANDAVRLTRANSPMGDSPIDLTLPTGRDRGIGTYYSLQHQFPATYGLGEAALPESAGAERNAQAKQLQAYLLFYDQILANYFSQLAHVKELLAFSGHSTRTYFAQTIADDGLGLESLLQPISEDAADGDSADWLQNLTELVADGNGGEVGFDRANRFLDHLLARFAEQLPENFATSPLVNNEGDETLDSQALDTQILANKEAFLQDYPQLGRARGTAYNYLLGTTETPQNVIDANISGLEQRLRRKLGSRDPSEQFYIVEHILLRPIQEDSVQQQAVIAALQTRDPFSLRITLVFPIAAERFLNGDFRLFVEQTVREEAPAHLTLKLCWLDPRAMLDFATVYTQWVTARANYYKLRLEPPTNNENLVAATHRALRATRDRLIDLLAFGQTFPLQDLPVVARPPRVATDMTTQIVVMESQPHTLYLLQKIGASVTIPLEAGSDIHVEIGGVGNGGELPIETDPITENFNYAVEASKLPWYLFSIDATFIPDLQSGIFSPQIRHRFHLDRRIVLSSLATVDAAETVSVIPIVAADLGDQDKPHRLLLLALGYSLAEIAAGAIDAALQVWHFVDSLTSVQGYIVTAVDGAGLQRLDVYYAVERKTMLLTTADVVEGLDQGLQAWIMDAEHLPPNTGTAEDALPRIVNYGSEVTVKIKDSQTGVTYQLVRVREGGGEENLSDTKLGNPDGITLAVPSVTEDMEIRVRAMRTDDATDSSLLDVRLPLLVRANPNVEIQARVAFADFQHSTLVKFGDPATIKILNAQAGTHYQLFIRNIRDREIWREEPPSVAVIRISVDDESNEVKVLKPIGAQPWQEQPELTPIAAGSAENGGELSFAIDALTADSLFIFKATRQHEVTSDLGATTISSEIQLDQAAVILVRPNSAIELTLNLVVVDGTNNVIVVKGGEPGIFYYFRQSTAGENLGEPAYFHKPDENNLTLYKGLNELAIEVDFVVTHTLATGAPIPDLANPLDPHLEAAPLAGGGTFVIRAVKAQTRAAIMLDATAQVVAG